MGRSRTVSYNFAATARVAGSAGKSRFRSSMGSLPPLDAALARLAHLFWRLSEVPTPRHPVLAPTEKSTDRRNIRSIIDAISVGIVRRGRWPVSRMAPSRVAQPISHIRVRHHIGQPRRECQVKDHVMMQPRKGKRCEHDKHARNGKSPYGL